MVFSLSSHNVIQYLEGAGLCSSEDGTSADSELLHGKNHNFVVTSPSNRKLLVKQERYEENHGFSHELFNEWLLHQLLERFPVLGNISAIASSLVHFDEENSILVRNYLSEYQELGSLCRDGIFLDAIASEIGKSLASLHRTTYERREYRSFMATAPQGMIRYQFFNPAQGISTVAPEIFGSITTEALKFYVFNQRYESLEAALADLASQWNPCCLTHNDLKLENILVHSKSENQSNSLVRLIDWEAASWGDPAFDLGTLIASYLLVWLESLVVDPTLELAESLQLAVIPVEMVQPTILALTRAYLRTFPMILEYRQDFVLRVVQFAGLAIINQLEETIKCKKHFDNAGICMLQVAKTLVTMPQLAVQTVFGVRESEIIEQDKLPKTEREQNLVRIYYEKPRLRGC
jgi:Ser/Thr protein kinase RdoA (MazF antagonist)